METNVCATTLAWWMNVVEGEHPEAVIEERRPHVEQVRQPIGIRFSELVSGLDEIDGPSVEMLHWTSEILAGSAAGLHT